MAGGTGERDQKPNDAGDGEPDQGQLQAKSEPAEEFFAMAPDDIPVETEHACIRSAPPLEQRDAPHVQATGGRPPVAIESLLVLDREPGRRRLELDAEVLGNAAW